MSRRKKGTPVHGWVILDKRSGMTSTQAVGAVRRIFDAQKAGHAGTLDPLATGILPIALGEATKTVSFAVDGEKAYRFTVRWGAETDTDDSEGRVTRTSEARPATAAIHDLMPSFTGAISQVPPSYSAIKVDGERAYDLARDGETVTLEPRTVVIDRIEAMAHLDADTTVFEAECGKGTYVRALARDFGRKLGCYGHVIALRRTRVGPFDEAKAITLEALDALAAEGRLAEALKPVESALDDLAALSVSSNDAARLKRGQPVLLRGRDAPVYTGPAFAISRGLLVAIGEIAEGELRPTRVFNLSA